MVPLLEDFAGDKLAFAAGIGGDQDLGCLFKQAADYFELILGSRVRTDFENLRNNRQIVP